MSGRVSGTLGPMADAPVCGERANVSASGELAASARLLGNWKSVVQGAVISAQGVVDARLAQQRGIFEGRNQRSEQA